MTFLDAIPWIWSAALIYSAMRLGFGFPKLPFKRHVHIVLPIAHALLAGWAVETGVWGLLPLLAYFIVCNAIHWRRTAS
ncbi:MAG: hypothetical protein OEU92_09540 [Alphaproteobacteria bacterium]|nr:hypothetical protein [Alphaproteobacteria bacterium]